MLEPAVQDVRLRHPAAHRRQAGFWGMVAICALIIAAWIVL